MARVSQVRRLPTRFIFFTFADFKFLLSIEPGLTLPFPSDLYYLYPIAPFPLFSDAMAESPSNNSRTILWLERLSY